MANDKCEKYHSLRTTIDMKSTVAKEERWEYSWHRYNYRLNYEETDVMFNFHHRLIKTCSYQNFLII